MNKRRIPMHHSDTRINALPRLSRPPFWGSASTSTARAQAQLEWKKCRKRECMGG
jgi:hypothetical protein